MSKENKSKSKSDNVTKGSGYKKRLSSGSDKQEFSDWAKNWKFENKVLKFIFGSQYERFKVGRVLFCIIFSFVFAFLITFEMNLNPSVKLGEIARQTVRAPFAFDVSDQIATLSRVKEELKRVPFVLDYRPNLYEEQLERIRRSFVSFRNKALDSKLEADEFLKANKSGFDKEFGPSISPRIFKWLYRNKFSYEIEQEIINVNENWATSYLIDESQLREESESDYALVRIVGVDGTVQGEEQKLSLNRISKIFSYENLENSLKLKKTFSKYDKKKIAEILRLLKKPNLELNEGLFAERKSEVKERSIPVVISVKKNQILLKEGALVQARDVFLIREISKHKTSFKKKLTTLLITFFLSMLFLVGLSLLKRRFNFSIKTGKQDFLVLFGICFFGVVVTRVFIFLFEGALYQKFGTRISADVIVLMSPFAMLFMLTALLVKSRSLIWLFIAYFSIGLSFLSSNQFPFLIISLIGGMASVRFFSTCKSRRDFYFAGALTGAIIGMSAIAVQGLELESFSKFEFIPFIVLFGASLIGGFLSAIFTVTFVPLFESVFDVMTDLKLLELSSLSHPLMKELMVRAPGTYHHCMVVGSMVEAACNEVGVNGLLGKVMAYFHDVGKMDHASYFIENQRKGNNPHDSISPYLSKTIIIAHVKDGRELIRKHGLGKAILAGVQEHHGTTLISYFYNKAKKMAEENRIVKEEEFRYPGPKPQFKESAILMLADSIEAAARSLDDINPLKIQTLIDGMVDSKFSDGQLDECDITFAELTKIKKIFYRILVGIYHHRVEYPKVDKSKQSIKSEKSSEKNKSLNTVPLKKSLKEKND